MLFHIQPNFMQYQFQNFCKCDMLCQILCVLSRNMEPMCNIGAIYFISFSGVHVCIRLINTILSSNTHKTTVEKKYPIIIYIPLMRKKCNIETCSSYVRIIDLRKYLFLTSRGVNTKREKD